jgi:transcriptional regulator with XRE-family HTH domain
MDAFSDTDPKRVTALAIRKLREEEKLTKQQVAERSGLSLSWLSRLESGKHESTWGGLKKVAQGLGVSTVDLTAEIERLEQQEEASR